MMSCAGLALPIAQDKRLQGVHSAMRTVQKGGKLSSNGAVAVGLAPAWHCATASRASHSLELCCRKAAQCATCAHPALQAAKHSTSLLLWCFELEVPMAGLSASHL